MISLIAMTALQAGTWIGGSVADIRGDIVQIRLKKGAELTRVVVGKSTTFARNELAPLTALKRGDIVFAKGEYKPGGPFKCRQMFGGAESGGNRAGDLEADSYSQLYQLAAVVVSNSPLVVKDAKGKLYKVVDDHCKFLYDVPKDRSMLQIGKVAYFHGKRTADGLTDVDQVWIDGTGLQTGGSLHGTVTVVSPGKLTLNNQFRGPTSVSVANNTAVYCVTDCDADNIKPGSKVYVQADVIPATFRSPEARLVRILAPGSVRRLPMFSDDPMIQSVEIRGTLKSVMPCRVKTAGGKTIELVVPGQALIVRVREIKANEIKPGDTAQISGEDLGDSYSAKYILVRRHQ